MSSQISITTDRIECNNAMTLSGNGTSITIGQDGEIMINSDLSVNGNINNTNNSAIYINANGASLGIGEEGTISFGNGFTIQNTRIGTSISKFPEYARGRGNCPALDGMGFMNSKNEIRFWGDNNYNRNGTSAPQYYAPGINLSIDPYATSAPSKHYCENNMHIIITANGEAYCAGQNNLGQFSLEDSSINTNSSPFKKSSVTNISLTALGQNGNTVYFLDTNGAVYASGSNNYGQIGDGTTTNTSSGGAFKTRGPGSTGSGVSGTGVVNKVITVGGWTGSNTTQTAMVLYGNGAVQVVGYGATGLMGDGTTTTTNSSWKGVDLSGFGNDFIVTNIQGAGSTTNNSFIILGQNSVESCVIGWGRNLYGELGQGNTSIQSSPVKIIGSESATDMWVHGTRPRLFVKLSDGEIWATGYNGNGCLGVGDTVDKSSLTQVTSLSSYDIDEIISFSDETPGVGNAPVHTIAYTSNGKILGSGYNQNGNLSLGDLSDINTFQLLYTPFNISSKIVSVKTPVDNENPRIYCHHITGIGGGTWVISDKGYMYYSGYNTYGALGDIVSSTDEISYMSLMNQYI